MTTAVRHTILELNKLSISFDKGSFVVVDGISFSLEQGETVAIVGESGSGKSLTAFAIAGLLPKDAQLQGTVRLHDGARAYNLEKLSAAAWQTLHKNTIGIVFQEPMSALNPVMKVGQQLMECIADKRNAKSIALDWLRKVQLPFPEQLFNRYPHQLSGGQKQRIMIAMAMCKHPALLIADEPTTALDVTVQKEIMHLMHTLQKAYGTSMIFITHDLALASEVSDKIIVMRKGKIVEKGYTKEVLTAPQEAYTRALLACRPSANAKGGKLPVVRDFLEGETSEGIERQPRTVPIIAYEAPPLLEAEGISIVFKIPATLFSKKRPGFVAVDKVSFQLFKGESLGLVGESGCGKSTLSKALLGLIPVEQGQLIYKGLDLARYNKQQWKPLRKQIQMIFQDPFASLNPRITIRDCIAEPLAIHGITGSSKEMEKEVMRLLDLVQLPSSALRRYPHQFSGGQRQRIGIARALAVQPELLICDESVSALDVSVQAQILNLLNDLRSRLSLSYLFISHDLNVVNYFCDRIMVMQKGRLIETGVAEQIMKHPHQAYTRSLIDALPVF